MEALALAKVVSSRVVWILLNAATGMITAHALGAAGRGALAAMILWPVFLAGALTFGLPSALVYWLRRADEQERVRLFTAATVLSTGVGIVASLIGFWVLPFWLSRYDASTVRWAQWLMLFTLVSMLMLIFRATFEAVGSFGRSASSWILGPIQTLIALLLLWRAHYLTEHTAALCYVFSGIPTLLWMFFRLSLDLGWKLDGFSRSARVLMSYGLRSYGIDLCGMLSQSVDQALVVGMISASEMGRYVVALSLSRTLNAVYQAAAAVLFPKCVGLKPRGAVQAMIRLTAASTAVVLPGAAILYFFGSVLLRLMYGSEYVIASTLLRILVFEAIFSGLTTLMSQPFMALGRPGTVTVLQALGLAATIPLLLLLVPRMGTVGAGLALLISAALRFLLLQLSYVRLAGRLPRLRDLSSLTESMVPARFSRRIAVEVRQ